MKNKILFLIMAYCILSLAAPLSIQAQSEREELQAVFNNANEFYRQQKYQEAIEGYLQIVEAGYENATIYYNLGNAYAKAGQKGYAILNYERAKKFTIRDQDLVFNEKYVRAQAGIDPEKPSDNIFTRMMNSHVNFYTYTQMIAIILLLTAFIGVIHLVSLYKQWPRKRCYRVLAILVVLLGVFVYGAYLKHNSQNHLAVIIKKSESFFEPSKEATVHFALPEGSKVHVQKHADGWVKIKRFDGKLGWVQEEDLQEI